MHRRPARHPRPIRRSLTALAVLLVAALLAGACGSSSSSATDSDQPSAPSSAEEGFPVTLEHAFGSTTLTEAPERIVVVGLKEQDYYLALGVVPVAIRDWYGDQPSATWPWAQAALEGQEPTVLARAQLDYEQIASLRPDVIVGLSSGMTEQEYELLDQIAPTIAQPEGDGSWAVTWQEMTLAAGKVTGRQAQAEALVDDLESRIAQVATDNPELVGASAAFASAYDGQQVLFSPETTASQVLLDLGLTMSDDVAAATDNADQSVVLSQERFDLLDADVVVWSEGIDDPGIVALLGNPLYADRTVRVEGRDVFLGKEANGAFVFASVLSLPYVLDEIVPALLTALDGDPSTTSAFSAR